MRKYVAKDGNDERSVHVIPPMSMYHLVSERDKNA